MLHWKQHQEQEFHSPSYVFHRRNYSFENIMLLFSSFLDPNRNMSFARRAFNSPIKFVY